MIRYCFYFIFLQGGVFIITSQIVLRSCIEVSHFSRQEQGFNDFLKIKILFQKHLLLHNNLI